MVVWQLLLRQLRPSFGLCFGSRYRIVSLVLCKLVCLFDGCFQSGWSEGLHAVLDTPNELSFYSFWPGIFIYVH